MTPLRRRMIEDMRLRNYAPRTIEIYVARIATFAEHFGKSPQRLGAADVRTYLLFLVQEKHASWSYYGQALSALCVDGVVHVWDAGRGVSPASR